MTLEMSNTCNVATNELTNMTSNMYENKGNMFEVNELTTICESFEWPSIPAAGLGIDLLVWWPESLNV
jgi:hypothetical protein